jgi:hypothetical protein
MANEDNKITVSWDDIRKTDSLPTTPVTPTQPQSGWGRIDTPAQPTFQAATSQGGALAMQSWFYLGSAGFIGAFLAWMMCEPSFEDAAGYESWGNVLLFPLMLVLMSVGYGTAESVVERSAQKGIAKGIISLCVGVVFGFLFNYIANVIYNVLLKLFAVQSYFNPLGWISRSVAWGVFGIAGGLVYGIVSSSGKKCLNGLIGGGIGAAIGGLLFDPISFISGGGEASRAIGMGIFGAATGISMGLVESSLKDRWLYVSSGPLAGKQFILYKARTVIGSSQSCDIYLFKDPSILPQHATIEHTPNGTSISSSTPLTISKQSVQSKRLARGDSITIGRYTLIYDEKQRS